MWTNTVILAGTVVVDGAAFRWCVTEGCSQHLAVSHPVLGTKTQQLTGSPDCQAREIGRAMLRGNSPFFEIDADCSDDAEPEFSAEGADVIGPDN